MRAGLIIAGVVVMLVGLILLVGIFTRAKPTEIHIHEHKK